MRLTTAVLLSAALVAGLAAAGAAAGEPAGQAPPKGDAPLLPSRGVHEILDAINAVGPYQVPDLKLKTDEKYAHIDKDLAPFHHVKPYKEYFLLQLEYTGPGRAIPEPEDVKTVKIGFIGPLYPTVSVATGGRSHEEVLGKKMLQGCQLALEEANARGGYLKRKIPFELVISNDNGLWGSSGNEIIKLAYKDQVWAILGTVDGANSHIAIRVALKAEIPIMNTGDTDPTFIETNIPWVCRVIGDDRQMGYILADYLYRALNLKRVGVIRSSNRYGRFGVRKVVDSSRRLGHPVILEMAYPVGSEDFLLQLERLRQADCDGIVHWGDAEDGARVLNQMRAMGMTQPFFACDRCVSDDFVKIAGNNAEGVVCTYPWDPTRQDAKYQAFRENFRKRFNEEAETYAAHAYDGMSMLIWAIQEAGLNRARIRDLLAYRTEPWTGVTGDITFSSALDDMGEVYLAKREHGAWKYYSRQALGIPRGATPPAAEPASSSKAFVDHREGPAAEYAGPGRDVPDPADVQEVLIGYFGPSDPADAESGDLWCAAQLAVEEVNRAGGCQGKPVRLAARWSGSPWTAGAADVARMVYQDRVWGIIGGIDGPTTHLAEQVVAKARLVLLSPAATDKTVNLANVPWMFSCLPGDHLLAPVLASGIAHSVGKKPLLLVSADDHDSHVLMVELKKRLAEQGLSPAYHFDFQRGTRDLAELAARIVESQTGAVVLLAGAPDSARLLVAIRKRGFAGPVFGGPAMGRRRFIDEAGPAAAGVMFPLLYPPQAVSSEFARTFLARFGRSPDYAAAHTYDAVQLLAAAINKAGLNRPRIGDAVRELAPWNGVTGTLAWDPLGSNVRAVRLGTISSGAATPVDSWPRRALPRSAEDGLRASCPAAWRQRAARRACRRLG